MDLFISNIPAGTTERRLREALKQPLQRLDIPVFYCSVFKVSTGYTHAIVTVDSEKRGHQVLQVHGTQTRQSHVGSTNPILLDLTPLCITPSKKPPDPILMECLKKDRADLLRRANDPSHPKQRQSSFRTARHNFPFAGAENGIWDIHAGSLHFHSAHQDSRRGALIFGKQSLLVVLDSNGKLHHNTQIRIPYRSILSLSTEKHPRSFASITLDRPPIFYDFAATPESLAMPTPATSSPPNAPAKARVCGMSLSHRRVVGFCGVYRFHLDDIALTYQLSATVNALDGGFRHVAASLPTPRPLRIAERIAELLRVLSEAESRGTIPHAVGFQLQRLAYNWFLSPDKVIGLVGGVRKLLTTESAIAVANAIKNTANKLPFLEPGISLVYFDDAKLMATITQAAQSFEIAGTPYQPAQMHQATMALVLKVFVTPCSITLEGPELESKNRVLRKYRDKTEYFVRVNFGDEDGQNVRFESKVDRHAIFQERFSQVINGNINLAGRLFQFLGFSHSSLRSQQCWFMAPFQFEQSLVFARNIIKDLGDFSAIRSPARCAARIGQAFSDTSDSISLAQTTIRSVRDIERGGRCFTDGVGAVSEELLRRVWKQFSRTHRQKATVLQIRQAGAKGMVSLDTRLQGEVLCLRPSMVKFTGSPDRDLEICGAGYRALPMYLNRSYIKILEDLGTDVNAIVKLQTTAVSKLQHTAHHPLNAANFLDENHFAQGSRLSSLIRSLETMDINFREDDFLQKVVDLALLMQLREIKYRARIPVPNAYTLLGVADWTSTLAEGQIYVSVRDDKGQLDVLQGNVLVTRSPALHPGDIRIADAVTVPRSCPLHALHNCIVFSTNGARDLPSCLSGGDLDGDLFNVIFEPSLWPKKIVAPADYLREPAIDIGREVVTEDMTGFFLTFMETDQLGYISNSHLQLADREELGTESPACLRLAQMASTAVDYSKTGRAVRMSDMPPFRRQIKPDFMSDAPSIVIDSSIALDDLDDDPDAPDDPARALEPDRPKIRYYRSRKALGILYRAIDENTFLPQLLRRGPYFQKPAGQRPLLERLWASVQHHARLVQWTHHRALAAAARTAYHDGLLGIMWDYSPQPGRRPLTELEVYSSCIQARAGGVPDRRTRDCGSDMKEAYERHVRAVVALVVNGFAGDAAEEDDDEMDALSAMLSQTELRDQERWERLGRCMAALEAALADEVRVPRVGVLRSWAYVVAAVCLRQMERVFGPRWATGR